MWRKKTWVEINSVDPKQLIRQIHLRETSTHVGVLGGCVVITCRNTTHKCLISV